MQKIINNLGNPTNNTETYLKYLTGTLSVSLQDLPKPYTNVDAYLYYLCVNGTSNSADKISFDDSQANLGANNVQDAIKAVVNVLKDEVAKLNEENTFTKKTHMEDVIFENSFDNSHFSKTYGSTSGKYLGIKVLSTGLFENGCIDFIRVYIHTLGANVTSISGIKLWEVDRFSDVYGNELNVSALPVQTENGENFIDIPINKCYANDTYFIMYLPPVSGTSFKALTSIPSQYRQNYVTENNPPTPGGSVPSTTNGYTIYAEAHGAVSSKSLIRRVVRI